MKDADEKIYCHDCRELPARNVKDVSSWAIRVRQDLRDIFDCRHWFTVRKCDNCGKEFYQSQVAYELRNPKLIFLLLLFGVTVFIVIKRILFGPTRSL